MEESTNNSKEVGLAQLLHKRTTEMLQAAGQHLNENSPKGAFARGNVFELAGYFDHAADSYKAARTLEATARLAIVHIKDAKPELALKTAMSVTAANPKLRVQELTSTEEVSALTILGDALVSNDRKSDAIQAYLAARKANAKESFAAGRLAQVYLATGEPKKALELGPAFAANHRFDAISSVLALGKTSDALLPAIKPESLSAVLRRSPVGRPLLVSGAPRLAPIIEGDQAWCVPTDGASAE